MINFKYHGNTFHMQGCKKSRNFFYYYLKFRGIEFFSYYIKQVKDGYKMKNIYINLHKIKFKIKEKLKEINHWPIFLFLIVTISISAFLLLNAYGQKSREIQGGIAEEIVRFHVVANSDSIEDQKLKLIIKDRVTKELEPLLTNTNSIDDARNVLFDNLISIENLANETIAENGFSYTAKSSLETEYFPLKVYGDIALPPGEYEAVKIELGSGGGENWWCVMFPPLCFVDSTYSIVPDSSKEQLENVLTEEEYNEILIKDDESLQVKAKFKIFTLFNDIFDLE